ncbi:conserved membrane hypothetical protein [Sulfurovum sp. enrichment culture clone C5]|uniref:Uncharacterized protein n=1 Tax=Sulfurovum sp. enrichment culture clone C5 TaxID=497650 RepID=A0A0S4XKW8_9BACT|nr:conserved membrane hypothetical protein [Sulfurovum sp. enrichment culture clone C5]
MDATFINLMRDPAGVPFFPVVFQGLYILTWALHAAFVLLALGALGLSLYGSTKQKTDSNWKIFNPHLIMTGKISVSMLILLGIAPLLFTQVIYDSGWYVANTLSGAFVFIFVYALIAGYMMYYWYSSANKKSNGGTLIGLISFVILVFCGILMHNFAVESISPDKWQEWYAPNGVIDNSGLNFHIDIIRLAFMVSLTIPVVGIFMQNYSDFLSTRKDFSSEYLTFVKNLGTKLAVVGLLISAVLFVVWMLQVGLLFHPVVLATIVSVVILLLLAMRNKNSYVTTGILVVVALFISGVRELIRYNIMSGLGYDLYGYPMNLEWETIIMFLLTFVILGFTGIAFILTMAWKIGKREGVFDASKDVAVTRLANVTLAIFVIWIVVYFAWGMVALFKNTL